MAKSVEGNGKGDDLRRARTRRGLKRMIWLAAFICGLACFQVAGLFTVLRTWEAMGRTVLVVMYGLMVAICVLQMVFAVRHLRKLK